MPGANPGNSPPQMHRTDAVRCYGCGALVPAGDGPTHRYIGASPGCWAIYGEVLAREYDDIRYARLHQVTVDAYAAQHPGVPSPQSIQSVTLHLVSLCVVMELGWPGQDATRVIQRIANQKQAFIWLEPPSALGEMTVWDLHASSDPEDHAQRVRRWGHEVWQAWAPHHATIRPLADGVARTLAGPRRRH